MNTLYFVFVEDEDGKERVEAIYNQEWQACDHAKTKGNEKRWIRSGRVIDWSEVSKWD